MDQRLKRRSVWDYEIIVLMIGVIVILFAFACGWLSEKYWHIDHLWVTLSVLVIFSILLGIYIKRNERAIKREDRHGGKK